jgi:hypothetical protein
MSGDIVRDQPAFQPPDLVLQHELALFQALQVKLVGGALVRQACDDGVEVAMLASQFVQFPQQGITIGQHAAILTQKNVRRTGFAATICLAIRIGSALGFAVAASVVAGGGGANASGGNSSMSTSARLESLRQRHASLEGRIFDEDNRPRPDSDALTRLKLEKLHVKDEMERIQSTH